MKLIKTKQLILEKLYTGNSISYSQSKQLFTDIIQKKLTSIQIAAVLIAMKLRHVTTEEVTGAINTFLKYAKYFPRPNYLFADITGTGGDQSNSINISTISAIVAASCGLKIAKHGNRGVSSNFGSTNVLSCLNIPINTTPENSRKLLDKIGICFLYAPKYHVGFNNVQIIRKQLKTRTLFNIIGPLINPAKPPLILIGVYKQELVLFFAKILQMLEYNRAIVTYCNGIDEISLHAPIKIAELNKHKISQYTLTAEDFGLNTYSIQDIRNNPEQKHYESITKILKGRGTNAHTSVIAANVAILFKLFGDENLKKNVSLVLDKIHDGIPYEYLKKLTMPEIKNHV